MTLRPSQVPKSLLRILLVKSFKILANVPTKRSVTIATRNAKFKSSNRKKNTLKTHSSYICHNRLKTFSYILSFLEFYRFFKECPHPDDKQRKELSRDLNLEPLQVKFWFQNKRTQMKVCNH